MKMGRRQCIVFHLSTCSTGSKEKTHVKAVWNRFLKSHIIIILLGDAIALLCIRIHLKCMLRIHSIFLVWHSRNSETIAPSNHICTALIQNSVISTCAFSSSFISFTWNDQIECIASCCTKCVKSFYTHTNVYDSKQLFSDSFCVSSIQVRCTLTISTAYFVWWKKRTNEKKRNLAFLLLRQTWAASLLLPNIPKHTG